MIVRRLANLFGTIRALLMAELEKNPQAIRQGAASLACVAVAAAAMPAISDRAAEQRSDALWAARAAAVHQAMADMSVGEARVEPAAPAIVRLASFQAHEGGFAIRGSGVLERGSGAIDEAQAIAVRTSLSDLAALSALDPFEPALLGKARNTASERRCLAEAIYYEARGESHLGQVAVAEVVLNRVRSQHYPDTICDVVYQGSYRATGCQFTFTCDGSLAHKPRGRAWRQANELAAQAMMGLTPAVTSRATHYHTFEVDPVWSARLVETTRIGAHIFYRFPNRRERSVIEAQLAAPEFVSEEAQPGDVVITPETDLGAQVEASAPAAVAAEAA